MHPVRIVDLIRWALWRGYDCVQTHSGWDQSEIYKESLEVKGYERIVNTVTNNIESGGNWVIPAYIWLNAVYIPEKEGAPDI